MTDYVEAVSLDHASRLLLEDADAPALIAGGTALVVRMTLGEARPTTLVGMRALESLRGIQLDDDGLWIGARTTLREIGESTDVRRVAPSLAIACQSAGNIRIRNVATIGGNLAEASHTADPPIVLTSLDARCSVHGPGATREIPLGELVTDFLTTSLEPAEVITGVRLAVPTGSRAATYRKFVARSSEDRTCVGVAARADYEREQLVALSVVVGAVAGVPQRFEEITSEAVGGRLGAEQRQAIAHAYSTAVDPIADARGSAWYRRRMIEVFVRRALEDVSQ